VDFEKLSDVRRGEVSTAIRARVEAARERQRGRFASYADGHGALLTNADTPALRAGASVGPGEIREFCAVDEAGHSLLRAAMRQLHMSARARLRRPHPQTGPHDRRPDRRRAHRDCASGGGDPVPAALAGVSDLAPDTLRQAGLIDGDMSLASARPHARPWCA
jgi:hypothetical protein